jgi:transcriptional regulator with XRE-family HTH domain
MGASRDLPVRYARFFRALGQRIRSHRTERGLSQENMFFYGFGVRHWQMIEAGSPITVSTLLRVCDAFEISPEQLVAGLAQNPRKRKRT